MLPTFTVVTCVAAFVIIACLAVMRAQQAEGSRALARCTLAGYIVTLLYITVFSRTAITQMRLHLIPFENFNPIKWIGFAENVILFLPAGALLLAGTSCAVHTGLWFGSFLSLCVELLQLISRRGIADIDDLLANTLGGLLGAAWYCLVRKAANKQNT